jgi:uncharacterized protein YbjQ (UPF0145 family)
VNGKASVRVILDHQLAGQKFIPIGRILAASSWHGIIANKTDEFYKAGALHNLIDVAQDLEADAITGIDYTVEHVDAGETPGSELLTRICARGVAVRLTLS